MSVGNRQVEDAVSSPFLQERRAPSRITSQRLPFRFGIWRPPRVPSRHHWTPHAVAECKLPFLPFHSASIRRKAGTTSGGKSKSAKYLKLDTPVSISLLNSVHQSSAVQPSQGFDPSGVLQLSPRQPHAPNGRYCRETRLVPVAFCCRIFTCQRQSDKTAPVTP